MRDFKGMKRQRGRNRGGGGGKPQHNANRSFESNGPDNVKVRGAAQGIFERYQQLARDASSAGDRVLAENYLQHAEHYFRTLRAMQPQRPASEILGRDYQASGFDIDFEADPEEGGAEGVEQTAEDGGEGEGQEQRQRDDRQRDDRPRDGQQRDRYESRDRQQQGDRQRDDRPRDGQQRDRYENRDRPRDDRPRDDRPRDDRPRDDRPRDDRPRDDRPREDRPQGEGRRDRWRDRDDRPRGDRDQQREPAATVEKPEPVAQVDEGAPVLRSEDGEVSHAPAFLGRASEPRDGGEVAPKAPRRRAPRKTAAEEA